MDFIAAELMSVFWETFKVLSIPLIIVGAVNCFFGYKIFRMVCAVNGFLAGAILGAILGMAAEISSRISGGEGDKIMAYALIGGIIGAVLAYALHMIAVFFTCFGTGMLLAALFTIATENYSGMITSAVIWGLLFGVLGVLLAKAMIILQTSINGALQVGVGMFLLTQSGASAVAAVILFFVLGLIVQSRNGGGKAPVLTYQVNTGVVQSVPQGTMQNKGRDREKEMQEMAQKAQQVMGETKINLEKALKKAKEDSGKYIDIGTKQGKKAEVKIEKGILLLQKNTENAWDYFEKNKKSLFPIMCAALAAASVIALL